MTSRQGSDVAKHPRNPKFKTESLTEMSWTRVVRDAFPYRHRAVCCPELAREGDIVVTVPIFRDGKTLGTAVIHQRCLATFFQKVPEDKTLIQKRAEHIIHRFRKPSVFR